MAACLTIVLLSASGACSELPAVQEAHRVRPLNEIPIEQLRATLKGFSGEWRKDSDQAKGLPTPPLEKPAPPGAKRLDLVPPGEFHLGAMPLRDAIASRRSLRTFSTDPLGRDELSFLLWCAQGITATGRNDSGSDIHQFRAAPSGGARYPLETYVAINRVDGFAPGLYRYLPSSHQLVAVRENADLRTDLSTACYRQSPVTESAVVLIWTAVPYRTEWKYAYLAHRMIAMEAGHVCQNVCLAAQSIGAGACPLLGYDQPRMDALIGADGRDEFTVYLACVGKPVKKND